MINWFFDLFGEHMLNLLLAIGGILLLVLLFVFVVFFYYVLHTLCEYLLWRIHLVHEPGWRITARELKEIRGNK